MMNFLRVYVCPDEIAPLTLGLVRSEINFLVGPEESLLATVKRRKLAWIRHVTHHDSLSKTIFQDALKNGRRRGRQRKYRMDNIKERASCHCQNCSERPPVEKTAGKPLLNRLSCIRDDPVG